MLRVEKKGKCLRQGDKEVEEVEGSGGFIHGCEEENRGREVEWEVRWWDKKRRKREE